MRSCRARSAFITRPLIPLPVSNLNGGVGYRKAIDRLLECVQGEWPPPSAGKALLKAFEAHLVERGIQELHVFTRHSRLFVEYLAERNLDAANVQPPDVTDYFRGALKRSKRHHPNLVHKPRTWFRMGRRTVHAILPIRPRGMAPGIPPIAS